MTRLGWMVFGSIAGAVLLLILFLFFFPKPAPIPEVVEPTSENLEGQSIYASGEYGFTLRYPTASQIEESFSSTYRAPTSWRVNALGSATGTPLLAVIAYHVVNEKAYPRYYTALVRLGVSGYPKEVKNCEKPTTDQGEEALSDVELNGTTWKAFSFESAGMMQYVRGVSYRTLHNGLCYALEKIVAGSSYKDDPPSKADVSQTVLDQKYADLDRIVETMTFSDVKKGE